MNNNICTGDATSSTGSAAGGELSIGVEVPPVSSSKPTVLPDDDQCRALNIQTAHNKTRLLSSELCGCFHCGELFSPRHIRGWLLEKYGEDTGRCPYCGVDALVTGLENAPLTKAVLASLYVKWFSAEYKELEKIATYVPLFYGHDDYFKRGIPYLLSQSLVVTKRLGEIPLWRGGAFDDEYPWLRETDASFEKLCSAEDDIDVESGGVVRVRAYFDEEGYYCSDFINEEGRKLPFEPWTGSGQDLLLRLTAEYGNSLKGIIKSPNSQNVELFI